MTALYIHVPFCQSVCTYCDFYVSRSKHGGQQQYIQNVLSEIEYELHTKAQSLGAPLTLTSIYVGGGTPTQLPASFYQACFKLIRTHANIAPKAEITLEANPNAMVDTPEAYAAVGFNRVSLGIQSLNDRELKVLSRGHSAQQALDAVTAFRVAGITNLSVDLMYGFPHQTKDSWQATLEQVAALPIQHVSFYGLQVHEDTPYYRLVKTPAYPLPPDEQTVSMFYQAKAYLETQGFVLYELSNMSRQGFESNHNKAYWRMAPFLGVGPGASGYWPQPDGSAVLSENARDLQTWYVPDQPGKRRTQITHYTQQQHVENKLVFGLRLLTGLHVPSLERELGVNILKTYAKVLPSLFEEKHLVFDTDTQLLRLNPERIHLSNTILSEFIDEPLVLMDV